MKKKAKSIQFQIPEPCHESWNKMTPLPGGRFCDSCEKTVVDFSEMTDNELVRFYQKNNHQVCGKFRRNQLNKEIPFPESPTRFKKWKAAAAVVAGLLAWNSVEAQYGFPAPTIPKVVSKKTKNTSVESTKFSEKTSSKFNFKGIVKDENGDPLIGANVLLEKGKETSTDFDGKFELQILSDWESFEITFSYLGYETQVIEFDRDEILNRKNATVTMVASTTNLNEIEVVGYGRTLIKKDVTAGLVLTIPNKIEKVEDERKEKVKAKKEVIRISNIYPNPFISFVNVKLEIEKADRYLFHLYNVNGQLIWAKTFHLQNGSQEIQLDFLDKHLAQGNYFLRITDGKREIQTKKIIKMNEKRQEDISKNAAGI